VPPSLFEKNVLPSSMKKCTFNPSRVQPPGSHLCGKFSVFFAHIRFSNDDLSQTRLMNIFFSGDDLEKNEDTVIRFFRD
jgi:hypothetical protein